MTHMNLPNRHQHSGLIYC